MADFPEIEIFQTVLFWMFHVSLFFSSLDFFSSMYLSLLQMVSAWVVNTSREKSSGGGDFLLAISSEWLPYGTDRL
jgi:hypothetical protein